MNLRDMMMAKMLAGGGVSSWNDLTDKPFDDSKIPGPAIWDGNIDGLTFFPMLETAIVCRISEEFLPTYRINGGIIHLTNAVNGSTLSTFVVSEDML